MRIKQSHGWCYSVPISKEEWDEGRTVETLESRILSFLREKRQGYTLAEIIDAVGYRVEIKDFWGFIGHAAASFSVNSALETLMKEGSVEAKVVKTRRGEETNYMAK